MYHDGHDVEGNVAKCGACIVYHFVSGYIGYTALSHTYERASLLDGTIHRSLSRGRKAEERHYNVTTARMHIANEVETASLHTGWLHKMRTWKAS
jgi:hypothetical protein